MFKAYINQKCENSVYALNLLLIILIKNLLHIKND